MERRYVWLVGLALLLTLGLLTACGGAGERAEITLMTHDSFDVSEEVLAAFETAHEVKVVLLPAGDAGTMINQAILAKEDPLADVIFGVDNTFLGRVLEADIVEPYDSPVLAEIAGEARLDPSNRLLPVDAGDVCINYDRGYFSDKALPVPQSLAELTDPAYRGLLVVENPATSSPGLAFLLATVSVFGTEGDYTYLDFWADLRANEVLVANDWNTAYYTYFTATGSGDRPMVVSYATSPAAEVIFADPPVDTAPTASITAPDTCFRQVEFVGILKGTKQRALAEKLVDFLLSRQFQEDMPLKMFVFPVNTTASLPVEFEVWATIPPDTANLDLALISANREAWIEAWTATVLR